jgi:hypothetical protein
MMFFRYVAQLQLGALGRVNALKNGPAKLPVLQMQLLHNNP